MILYNTHSDPLAGHFSIEETYRRIKIRYYWPQMFNDVRCNTYPSNRMWRSSNYRNNIVYSAVYGAVVIDLI
jgi:Integrase zinc binding domain